MLRVDEVQKVLGTHADALKVRRLIGYGGFGSVWLAQDLHLGGRSVALKVLDCLGDYEGVKAYAGGVRQHPNLLQIFFCDVCGDKLFYAMELADNVAEAQGGYRADTLADRLLAHAAAGTRPSAADIRATILGILNGLDAMHACGFCHRDIKPENIIFVAGVPKISDVGSVRRITEADTRGITPGYLPPEMCEGAYDPVGHDLYAVGMLVYCMLALHGGADYPIIDDLNVLKDKTCRRLNAFVTERACSDDPSRRYHDIASFRNDFERCFRRLPLPELVTGGIFVVTVLALVGWGLHERYASRAREAPHALKLSKPLYLDSSTKGIPSIRLHLSDEIRRSDLPLTLVLPDVKPGTTLRLAPIGANAIPETLHDVYGSWPDWRIYPSCSMLFLRGRGATVSFHRDFEIRHRRHFVLGELFADHSRKVVITLSAAAANGMDLTVNGRLVAADFAQSEPSPVRLLVGLATP